MLAQLQLQLQPQLQQLQQLPPQLQPPQLQPPLLFPQLQPQMFPPQLLPLPQQQHRIMMRMMIQQQPLPPKPLLFHINIYLL